MIPAIGAAYLLKRRRVLSYWPYLVIGGGLSWWALYLGGVHPALALVPILPFMPHAKRDLGIYDVREDHLTDTMNQFEHAFKVPVQIVLLLFGLVNAGVPFGSIGSGTWIVFAGLVAGKPIGILLMTFIGVKMGLKPPGGLTYSHALVVGVAAGIGFTVALFFASAAFPPGIILDEVKMGALFSFLAAPLAIAIGRGMGLRPGQRKAAAVPLP
jgi:NhaA family Na+:H+ antiporter